MQWRLSIGGFHSRICSGKKFKQIFQRWHSHYKLFVIGGWSKMSLKNDTANDTATLILILKSMFSAFMNCYLSLGIILMILIIYTSLVISLLEPMAKDSTNFANTKLSSGTRINETDLNDHLMSPGCDMRIEILLINCGDMWLLLDLKRNQILRGVQTTLHHLVSSF